MPYEIEMVAAPPARSGPGAKTPERLILEQLFEAPVGSSVRFASQKNRGDLLRAKAKAISVERWFSVRADGPEHVRVFKIAEPSR